MSLVEHAACAQRLDRLEVEVLEDGPDLSSDHALAIANHERAAVAKDPVGEGRRGLVEQYEVNGPPGGLLQPRDQATDLEGLDALAAERPITAYIGFDCTADSLHIGNLVSIMLLRLVQRTGHRPIALVGGGTSKIGDPSGKDESRQLLDDATLATYIAGVRRSLEAFLRFGDGPGDAAHEVGAGAAPDRGACGGFLRTGAPTSCHLTEARQGPLLGD